MGIDPTAIFRVDSDNEGNATIRIGPFVLLRYCQIVQSLSLHRSRLFAPPSSEFGIEDAYNVIIKSAGNFV
jgi:hypothetical protein